MSAFRVGDIQVTPVVEVPVKFKADGLLPDATPQAIEKQRDWLVPRFQAEDGLLLLVIQAFVVKTRHHTVLIDTCFGNDKNRGGRGAGHMRYGPFLQDLAAAGANPELVDYVLCTHLHVDHVGWNTMLRNGKWVPTFPGAKYLFGRKDWEYFQKETKGMGFGRDSLEDSVKPIVDAGLAELVDGHYVIEDGVRLEPLEGHTPGHMCVRVSSGGREAVFTGDMMHHALQVAYPEWSSIACYDAQASRVTRKRFVEQHADRDVLVVPAHFPVAAGGRIVKAKSGFQFRPA